MASYLEDCSKTASPKSEPFSIGHFVNGPPNDDLSDKMSSLQLTVVPEDGGRFYKAPELRRPSAMKRYKRLSTNGSPYASSLRKKRNSSNSDNSPPKRVHWFDTEIESIDLKGLSSLTKLPAINSGAWCMPNEFPHHGSTEKTAPQTPLYKVDARVIKTMLREMSKITKEIDSDSSSMAVVPWRSPEAIASATLSSLSRINRENSPIGVAATATEHNPQQAE